MTSVAASSILDEPSTGYLSSLVLREVRLPLDQTIRKLFDADAKIRYVALYLDGTLTSRERPGLSNTSASESDKYEELIVNPTLLKLVQQRGNIDCGGAQYVLIRYGNFFEFVQPVRRGHVSVGIEAGDDPMKTLDTIRSLIESDLQ